MMLPLYPKYVRVTRENRRSNSDKVSIGDDLVAMAMSYNEPKEVAAWG